MLTDMAETQTVFKFPEDWPADGPIDLSVHDLPHASSTLEWWYMNTHITSEEGKEYSVFASFFRRLLEYKEDTKELVYAHSITWALIDIENKDYKYISLVDKRTPEIGLDKLKKGEMVKDHRLRRAAIEMLEKGNVPYPDRLFKNDPQVETTHLYLNMDGNSWTKLDDGRYQLDLYDEEQKVGCQLFFTPEKPVTRHGDNGVVMGVSAEDMFYYFIPKNKVEGKLIIDDEDVAIKSASGWYDHEFGKHRDEKDGEGKKGGLVNNDIVTRDVAWNWLSVQADNGCELSAYDLIDYETKEGVGKYLIVIDQDGNRHQYEDFELKPVGNMWTSTRTFNDYPMGWELICEEANIHVFADAMMEQQEFSTVISKPAFWEGKMKAHGKWNGTEIGGFGFVERHGFVPIETMDHFFKRVSRETIKSVQKIIPTNPDRDKLSEIVSKKGDYENSENIDGKVLEDSMIAPIRMITDRGGKSWRSYAALACCDVVGGNSQEAKDWLSLPEILHVGSLIVDDVEDKSKVRRGGQTVHDKYGEPLAINAGSACYFIGQICVYNADITDKEKLDIYNIYFETLRAAHAGQALDINGLDYMMDDVVANGKGELLESRVLGIHRLKSAVPASNLAKIGAILGGGSEEQIQGLADYFLSIGIAFQIIDDVLNLKGFQDELKSKAEDITAGKVTYPVAKAMTKLDKTGRERLWKIVQQKTDDITTLGEAVSIIAGCGALSEAEKEAKDMVEDAWTKLDAVVRDSMVKLNLRAFSWYVLDRQY